MKFELNQKQIEKINHWKEAIKTVYGEYGKYSYMFTPDGINSNPSVYSFLADTELYLTCDDKEIEDID